MEKSLVPVLAALALACTPAIRSATLRPDSTLAGGHSAQVTMDLPGAWVQTVGSAERAEFTGPDNFSRATLVALSVDAEPARWPEIAQVKAKDALAELSRVAEQVEFTTAPEAPERVDFKATLPGSVRGPSDRALVGRVICRGGAVAIATCSVGVERKSTLGDDCQKALASLRVEAVARASRTPAPAGMDRSAAPVPENGPRDSAPPAPVPPEPERSGP